MQGNLTPAWDLLRFCRVKRRRAPRGLPTVTFADGTPAVTPLQRASAWRQEGGRWQEGQAGATTEDDEYTSRGYMGFELPETPSVASPAPAMAPPMTPLSPPPASRPAYRHRDVNGDPGASSSSMPRGPPGATLSPTPVKVLKSLKTLPCGSPRMHAWDTEVL